MGSIGRRLRKVSHRTQTQLGDTTSRLTENLAGARLIKAFRLENYAIDRLNENFEAVFQLQDEVGAHARAAPRRRSRRWPEWRWPASSGSPTGASSTASARSATSWASSPRCCMVAQPLRVARQQSPPRPWRAWPPPIASTSCSTRSPPSSTVPGAKPLAVASGSHRVRPGRLLLQLGGRTAGGHRLLADRARRQDGGPGGPLRRRQVDRHQPGGAPVRRRAPGAS